MRTIIDLPTKQKKAVMMLSKQKKISMAELIRSAIDRYLQEQSANSDTDSCFGIWSAKKVDGVTYQKRIRKEWDDEGGV